MPAPDVEALKALIRERLMAIVNTELDPEEPLVRDVYDLLDEAMREDDTPRKLPNVGIMHDDEVWGSDEILGADVGKEGREHFKLVVLCDSVRRGGGFGGKRGASKISQLIIDDIEGWQIIAGCPVSVDRRRRYDVRNENGELIPVAGYVLEVSHPVSYET